jgi:hypothetical protein
MKLGNPLERRIQFCLFFLSLVTANSGAQELQPVTETAHCTTEDPAAVEALHARRPLSVERMTASCLVQGGPFDGARMTSTTLYLMNSGRGKLTTGYVQYRDGDTRADAEVIQGTITASEDGGWAAEGRNFYKTATGRATSVEGAIVDWRARNTGPNKFEIRSTIR